MVYPKISYDSLFRFLTLMLPFLILVFNPEMAILYFVLTAALFIWVIRDPLITFPIEKDNKKRLFSLGIALMLYGVFLIGSGVVAGTITEIIKNMATTTPIFAENKILVLFSWGILIPIIETAYFFGVVFEGFIQLLQTTFTGFSTKFDFKNKWLWFASLFISGIFMFYHIQAKGIFDPKPLIITFIFALVSCWVVLYFRQTREAILLHMVANTVATVANMGLFGIVIGTTIAQV